MRNYTSTLNVSTNPFTPSKHETNNGKSHHVLLFPLLITHLKSPSACKSRGRQKSAWTHSPPMTSTNTFHRTADHILPQLLIFVCLSTFLYMFIYILGICCLPLVDLNIQTHSISHPLGSFYRTEMKMVYIHRALLQIQKSTHIRWITEDCFAPQRFRVVTNT